MSSVLRSSVSKNVFWLPPGMAMEDRIFTGAGWYFTDETEQLGGGPYLTEKEALEALKRYADSLTTELRADVDRARQQDTERLLALRDELVALIRQFREATGLAPNVVELPVAHWQLFRTVTTVGADGLQSDKPGCLYSMRITVTSGSEPVVKYVQ